MDIADGAWLCGALHAVSNHFSALEQVIVKNGENFRERAMVNIKSAKQHTWIIYRENAEGKFV